MKNHIKILTILRSLVPFKMLPGKGPLHCLERSREQFVLNLLNEGHLFLEDLFWVLIISVYQQLILSIKVLWQSSSL